MPIQEDIGDEGEGPPKKVKHRKSHVPKPVAPQGWIPDLNPEQMRAFNCAARYILMHGEKGTGKTIGGAHKAIRHGYENMNAFTLMFAPYSDVGSEGIWYDLDTLVLPQWKDGLGIEYTPPKIDPTTKKRYRFVENMHGGWSKVTITSIPHATQVEDRVKGPAPSMVYGDELTNCEGPEYFTYPASQLGRRRWVTGPQQYVASCNPKGPSHWVYKYFIEKARNPQTGEVDPDYGIFHIPILENEHRLPAGYMDQLRKIWSNDPIEYDRLINGKWIDRPTGKGIFKLHFIKEIHVRGDTRKGVGFKPMAGQPIIVGHDPGPVNYSIHFLQLLPTRDRGLIWVVFDELNFVGATKSYYNVMRLLYEKLAFWNTHCNTTFTVEHIADEAAFNKRTHTGSFEVAEIHAVGDAIRKDFFPTLAPVRLKACPKGPGSVAARVRLVQTSLLQEQLFISATCPRTVAMFENLESEANEQGGDFNRRGAYDPEAAMTPRRSVYIHPFDSLSYPMLSYGALGSARMTLKTDRNAVKPEVYTCGRN